MMVPSPSRQAASSSAASSGEHWDVQRVLGWAAGPQGDRAGAPEELGS